MSRFASRSLLTVLATVSLLAFSPPGQAATGALDYTFDAGITWSGTGSPGYAFTYSSAIQPDGKIIVGGAFDGVGGATRNNVARLNANGSLDTGFNPNVNNPVWHILVQDDEKILIMGGFSTVGGTAQNYLARLNTDGTLDTSFAPVLNNSVYGAALQPDGKIVIGGMFTSVNGTTRNRIARLNSDGTLDTSFDPNANAFVENILIQPDGKMVVTGFFTSIVSTTRYYMARLNADGTLDSSFNSPSIYLYFPPAVALLPDGKLLVTEGSWVSAPQVYRLNTDGSYDSGFSIYDHSNGGSGPSLYQYFGMAVQCDGSFFMCGNSSGASLLLRLYSGGGLDTLINTFGSEIQGVTLQPNGKMLVNGQIPYPGTDPVKGLFRLDNDTATQNLSVPGSNRVQWLRGGTSPEATSVRFDISTDGGSTWSALGAGTRISGGWELTGLSLPSSGLIRARAAVASGRHGTSRSLIEATTLIEAEIELTGNSSIINDGDASPSSADHTDFGPTVVSTGTFGRQFTIQNLGGATLSISSIDISGTHAADFSVSGLTLPTTVAAHTAKSFYVNFDPGALGTRTATVTVNSDDASEAAYDFAIQGQGIEPEINITGNGSTIASGDTTPAAADHTDFGTPSTPGGTVVRTFTIQNTGSTDLIVSGLYLSNGAPFTAGGISLPATVAPSTSTTFTVTFNPVATGTFDKTVNVYSNDGNENPYTFAVTGFAAPEINVTGNGTNIADGDTSPALADDTDFDIAMVSGEQVVSTYTIQNLGTGPLTVSSISKSGTNSADFTLGGISTPATVNPGASTTFTVTFDPSATGTRTATITIASSDSNEASYDFAVSGRGADPGELDSGYNPNASSTVYAFAEQPDGKVIVGGLFGSMGGVTHGRLARVNADGTVDSSFTPTVGIVGSSVQGIAIQPDGKIIVGGVFAAVNGTTHNYIARLNSDGTTDTGFTASVNDDVTAMVLQPDGKILIGGTFTQVNSTARNRIARLNSDGTLDTGFNPNANAYVRTIALQDDGKILIGGGFGTVGGVSHPNIARLNSDGTLDSGFTTSVNNDVLALALQSDGKIIVGGIFTQVNSTARARLARLNSDGTLDTTGFTAGANGNVYCVTVQADGKVYASGTFTSIASTGRSRVARLNADGSIDSTTTNPAAGSGGVGDQYVFGTSVQKNGQVLIGGDFATVQSTSRSRIARLESNLATESLSKTSSSRVEWLRGSSSPEVQNASFELSTDGGSTWSSLGSGTRISGGWELTGLSLPGSGRIRARAITHGGKLNASNGLVETILTY